MYTFLMSEQETTTHSILVGNPPVRLR